MFVPLQVECVRFVVPHSDIRCPSGGFWTFGLLLFFRLGGTGLVLELVPERHVYTVRITRGQLRHTKHAGYCASEYFSIIKYIFGPDVTHPIACKQKIRQSCVISGIIIHAENVHIILQSACVHYALMCTTTHQIACLMSDIDHNILAHV